MSGESQESLANSPSDVESPKSPTPNLSQQDDPLDQYASDPNANLYESLPPIILNHPKYKEHKYRLEHDSDYRREFETNHAKYVQLINEILTKYKKFQVNIGKDNNHGMQNLDRLAMLLLLFPQLSSIVPSENNHGQWKQYNSEDTNSSYIDCDKKDL